jgi:hypothetical protein
MVKDDDRAASLGLAFRKLLVEAEERLAEYIN